MNLRIVCVAALTVSLGALVVSCSDDKSPTKPGGNSQPPAIESTIPASDASAVEVTVQPAVTFTKEIDPLTGPGSLVVERDGVAVEGELSFNGRTITFAPTAVLDSGADYFVTVKTTVYDKDGLSLAAPYSWRFSTVARPAQSYGLAWMQASGGTGSKITAVDIAGGGAGVNLTTDGNARWLRWSPNGQKMFWVSVASGCNELWTMNADGSAKTKIASGPTPCPADYGHSWSPDGAKIAVLTSGTVRDLYVMNADGSNPVLVASDIAQAEWSGDGLRFAVLKGSTMTVINADGSGAAVAAGDAKAVIGWKAMSDTLVYVNVRDSLTTIRAGGSDKFYWQPLQYFVEANKIDNVALTKDGSRVVYQQHYQIHYTNFVTGIRHFVNLPYETREIDVSSDGQWMAVVTTNNADADIVLVSFDGTQAVNLTNSAGVADRAPRFRPEP